jgi:hypothetical protein
MEVNGDKKSMRISLDTSPLFHHTVSKLVQALAVEGDVLLPKQFLNPSHRAATTRPLWTLTCLADWKNISQAGDFHLTTPSKPMSRNRFWNGFWTSVLTVEKYGTPVQRYSYAFLFSLTSNHVKNRKPCFLTSSFNLEIRTIFGTGISAREHNLVT